MLSATEVSYAALRVGGIWPARIGAIVGKLVINLVLLVVLAAAVIWAVNYFKGRDAGPGARDDNVPARKETKPRVEEKYGFTSEGVAP